MDMLKSVMLAMMSGVCLMIGIQAIIYMIFTVNMFIFEQFIIAFIGIGMGLTIGRFWLRELK